MSRHISALNKANRDVRQEMALRIMANSEAQEERQQVHDINLLTLTEMVEIAEACDANLALARSQLDATKEVMKMHDREMQYCILAMDSTLKDHYATQPASNPTPEGGRPPGLPWKPMPATSAPGAPIVAGRQPPATGPPIVDPAVEKERRDFASRMNVQSHLDKPSPSTQVQT